MQPLAPGHPHALLRAAPGAAGMALPAYGPADQPRGEDPLRAALDIAGGVAFAFFIGILCMRAGSLVFAGTTWATAIGWESVWLVAAMLCSPLLPSGIHHDISWRSTRAGLLLDWPELVYATWVLGAYVVWLGGLRLEAGPIGLALAVGTAEEFIFRVLLLGWLVTRVSTPTALAISSVAFGVAHLHEFSALGFASVIPQTAGGFVLGAVYLRTRNPIGPILAHAYWDFPYFMARGAGVTGGGTDGGVPPIVAILPWLGFMVYGIWLVRAGIPIVGRVHPVACDCRSCDATRGAPVGAPLLS
ncbi:MAG: rane protein [Thermoleophilia bacterium]|nr:rane protein [Thermoleophilia bacterium]